MLLVNDGQNINYPFCETSVTTNRKKIRKSFRNKNQLSTREDIFQWQHNGSTNPYIIE